MIYSCVMVQRRYFNIESDSDEEVVDWLSSHNMQDVDNLTKDYTDEFEDRVIGSQEIPTSKAHFKINNKIDHIYDDAYMGTCPRCGAAVISGKANTECWHCGEKIILYKKVGD